MAKVLWIIALTKVLSEIAGTKIFVVKITVKSIVLKLWLMIHRLMTPVKKLESKSFPFAVFHVDSAVHDDTSGYDSRCCNAPSLAGASPPDSKVNNTPFPHTSCQPEVPTAATPSTLPQRPTKPNQPTARSEHL